MTIANLGELRGAIEDNLARADFPYLFPVYVRVFESKLNTAVRVAEMESERASTVVNGMAVLPANFLELRNVQGQQSNPTYYLSGNNLVFTSNAPDFVDVLYYGKLPRFACRLWILTGCYRVIHTYISMGLLLSWLALQDSSIVQLYKSLYESALAN